MVHIKRSGRMFGQQKRQSLETQNGMHPSPKPSPEKLRNVREETSNPHLHGFLKVLLLHISSQTTTYMCAVQQCWPVDITTGPQHLPLGGKMSYDLCCKQEVSPLLKLNNSLPCHIRPTPPIPSAAPTPPHTCRSLFGRKYATAIP
jgi:hypothetical protein